ncbi:endonuclease/exonuclease/phosphatase family protein [Phaeobacter sp. C3_T13_0]|uniref:endonuclease/exonuclease/phosphatase family protein n=1 Tax=Phaeobacter cretensis TaxID=3342641 RepID=UPI0039BCF06A
MLRIATYNLENLDEDRFNDNGELIRPGFAERAPVLRAALERLRADIICLQEVHGQETEGEPRQLLTLQQLVAPTRYADYKTVSTMLKDGSEVYDKRNLVVLVRPDIEVIDQRQINGEVVGHPHYKRQIAGDETPKPQTWERPLQHVTLRLPTGQTLHVLNAHFKSKLAVRHGPSMEDRFTWKSAAAWAEGFFVSSLKRVGAALEARAVVDQIFDNDADAAVILAGDFNALPDEVPVMALRGRVEETGNADLTNRVLLPLENNIPEDKRFTLIHHGKGEMIDHILGSRRMVECFMHSEVHNEGLQDESIAFATDRKFPASDHAPMVVQFDDHLMPPVG